VKSTNNEIDRSHQKIIGNIAFKSRAGSAPGNIPKTNQDNFLVNTVKDGDFFAVCDGHGVNGHLVSHFLKENLGRN
jgi:serine/threonine protein phosphatase PrpC